MIDPESPQPAPLKWTSALDQANPLLSVKTALSNSRMSLESTSSFKQDLFEKLGIHYSEVKDDCVALENEMKETHERGVKQKEMDFQTSRNAQELASLKASQSSEIHQHQIRFETFLNSKLNSTKYKALSRKYLLQTKLRDLKIIQQETNSAMSARMEQALIENRTELSETIAHMEEVNSKKLRNLIDLQESHIKSEKAIHDLEIRHIPDEMRSLISKKFAIKQTHQKILDKKILDQLRDFQSRELKQKKELFDFKIRNTNFVFTMKKKHQESIQTLQAAQYKDLKEQEEALVVLTDNFKIKQLQRNHEQYLKKLAEAHEKSYQILEELHHTRQGNSSVISSNRGLESIQHGPFKPHEGKQIFLNMYEWGESVFDTEDMFISTDTIGVAEANTTPPIAAAFCTPDSSSTASDFMRQRDQIRAAQEDLAALVARQAAARQQQRLAQEEEVREVKATKLAAFGAILRTHEAECAELLGAHARELADLRAVHDREVAMEQTIHDAECQALTERRILSSVLDSVIDGIIIIDTAAVIRRLNSAVEKIFGYKSDEIGKRLLPPFAFMQNNSAPTVGKNINILMPDHIANRHDEIVANYLKTGVKNVIGVGRRLMGKRKGGQLFNIHLSVTEVKQEGVHLFTGVIRDVTNDLLQEDMLKEQRKRDEELQLQTIANEKRRADEAEKLRKQQERYIDMICHEIRNPLNGIQNNNELISDLINEISSFLKASNACDNEAESILNSGIDAIAAINHCAKQQKAIADDVLNMSKLRISDSIALNPIALTTTIFETFKVEATKKKLDLILSVSDNLQRLLEEANLFGDPARLSQILINLISNAIKFTEKEVVRRITVDIDTYEATCGDDGIGASDAMQMLQFVVSDSGIGMNKEELDRLFKQFSQGSHKTYADYGGSGLGLFISKELISLMGGEITVRSEKGCGTSMHFTVRVKKMSKSMSTQRPREKSAGKTLISLKSTDFGADTSFGLYPESKGKPIMVVDDNTINRKVLKAHLERANFLCEEFEDGQEALTAFTNSPTKFCLILMDLEMPVMDGLTSAQKIREEEARLLAARKIEYQIPIMAVTGNARYDPDHSPQKFGMQGVMLKPFSKKDLLKIISQFSINP
ncbi:hypothetical protein HDU83_000071 [Entophlyctis luteolus]|nr:hypothetical protein HDU83_000071 [Entophlyctis luteolus]